MIDPAAIKAILDDLSEARRYAAVNPSEATRLIARAIPLMKATLPLRLLVRLLQNLAAGVRFKRVDPDVLRGYCLGAILEIQDWEAKNR